MPPLNLTDVSTSLNSLRWKKRWKSGLNDMKKAKIGDISKKNVQYVLFSIYMNLFDKAHTCSHTLWILKVDFKKVCKPVTSELSTQHRQGV